MPKWTLKIQCHCFENVVSQPPCDRLPSVSSQGPQQGMLEGDFALCISLYHGYELLMQMGLRSLFFYLLGIMDGSRGEALSHHPDIHCWPSPPPPSSLPACGRLCVMSCVWSEMSRARNELLRTPTLMDLYHEMEAKFVKPSAGIFVIPT